MSFERILAAVGFAPNSLEAFRVAVDLSRGPSVSLHLLHVIEARPAVPVDVAAEIVQQATAAIARLVASSPAALEGTSFTTEIASGPAFDEIVDRAREWRADLIALGAKGTTSLEEIILGGTAEQVMKEAPCSVLIVRPYERAALVPA